MSEHSSVFDAYPVVDYPTDHVGPPDGVTIEQAFNAFHAANPHVYDELVRLARQAVRRGVRRLGIGMLFEVLRWRHALRTGGDEFKLNNNYRSYYARLIMLTEPDLDGVFETRQLHAGSPADPAGAEAAAAPGTAAAAEQLTLDEARSARASRKPEWS